MAHDGSQRPRERRQWTEAERRRMVREVAESGLSIAKVARRNDVHPSVLGRWCRNTKVADPPSEAEPPERREIGTAEVVLRNGRRIVVAEDVPALHLKALVAALEEA